MTLQEALQTGKRLKRQGVMDFLSYEAYYDTYGVEREDILATDWEVSDEAETFTKEAIAIAWNAARGSSLAVKPAGESAFYKSFVNQLFGS